MHFFPFGCICDRFATTQNSNQNRSHQCNYCKSLCHNVALKLFATTAPEPHHWTLNSCSGAFLSIWVHLGPFRYCTKLCAKWANLLQLMQKFVPQSLVRISRNICSRSTQLDPKLMFSCVSFRLGPFGTVSLLHKTRNKTGHTVAINAKVRATMSCYKFGT
jgi:hypothetical protein